MCATSNDRLVVVVLLNTLYEWSQNFITRELVELQHQGVEIHVGAKTIVQREDLTPDEQSLRHNFFRIPNNAYTPVSLWKHLTFAMKHPLRYLNVWMTFFTCGHRRLTYIGRSLACLFRAAALADVLLKKHIQVIHAHFLGTPTETALYLSKLTHIPFGCTGHARDIYQAKSGLTKKIDEASYITTCTEANALYLKSINGSTGSKLFVIHHGLVGSTEQCDGTTSITPFTFLAVGRLLPKKGFADLVEACWLLKQHNYQFRCRIVGDGPLSTALQEHVEKLQLCDDVTFTGYIAPHHMHAIYQSGHALVVPSIIEKNGDRDGLPNVCLEAMAHGLPVIGTNISGIPEAVIDGVTGILVPPSDAQALSAAMVTLLTSRQLEKMGKAAHDIVREKFDLRKNVRMLKAIIERHRNF